jgi:hypothetical protein
MKITVIKKAANKAVRAVCPWVIEDWSDAKKK